MFRVHEDLGPLMGIPIGIKDSFDTCRTITSYGSALFSNHVPVRDAEIVSRLWRGGAVCVGKTNMFELAVGVASPYFGRTNNPADPNRTAGGSSGGSAAAVGSEMAYCAIGTDHGGSIRAPAAYCGVVGLKPTHGRVSLKGALHVDGLLDHAGPFGRSVDDVELVAQVIYDRWSAVRRLGQTPAIGLLDWMREPVDASVGEALTEAL